ncbi:MAG: hypothetical protein KGP27_19360 [Hyphomicrobiales bacterium]|nr:hypothetical protein [Hyphomicrobiales bacterium]
MRHSRFTSAQDGAVIPTFAVGLVVVVAMIGLAVDWGRTTTVRSRMQASLDSAVIAAAKNLMSGNVVEVGTSTFNNNLKTSDIAAREVAFSVARTRVNGTADVKLATSFLKVLGIGSIDVRVRSSAVLGAGASVCILILDRSSPQTFLVNSGADVSAPKCEAHVKSTASPAAIYNAGSSIVTARTCIEGDRIIDNGGIAPNRQTSCSTISDPFRSSMPSPGPVNCTPSPRVYNGGSVTLWPGTYCGGINFNAAANVTLLPGLYVISGGDWNVDGGTWTGNEMTFYFADASRIQFNSAVAAKISAPRSGTYRDIAFFEAPGLSRSQFVFDDSRSFDIRGLIYLPSRDVTFNSGSGMQARKMTIVVNTLILDQTRWTLEPSDLAPAASASGTPYLAR